MKLAHTDISDVEKIYVYIFAFNKAGINSTNLCLV